MIVLVNEEYADGLLVRTWTLHDDGAVTITEAGRSITAPPTDETLAAAVDRIHEADLEQTRRDASRWLDATKKPTPADTAAQVSRLTRLILENQ